MAKAMGVPLFTTCTYSDKTKMVTSPQTDETARGIFHLSPSQEDISAFVTDVLDYHESESVAILYEHNVSDMISKVAEEGRFMVARQLRMPMNTTVVETSQAVYMVVLDEVRHLGIHHIILQTSTTTIQSILYNAMLLGMLSQDYHWMLLNADAFLLDLSRYVYSNTNLTLFRLSTDEELFPFDTNEGIYSNENYQAVLFRDALAVISAAVHDYTDDVGEFNLTSPSTDCSAYDIHTHSMSMKFGDYIARVRLHGASGNVSFNSTGSRDDVYLDVIGIQDEELKVIGNWTSQKGLSIDTAPQNNASKSTRFVFGDVPLRVSTILFQSFLFWKDGHENLQGNDRFGGFIVDFTEEIAKRLNFKYEMILVPDGNYGVKLDDGSWNGMVRELIDDRADVIMAPFTISSTRSEAIDFSAPYIFLGTDILMKKPALAKPNAFSFLSPLSAEMWICGAVVFVIISLLLTLVNKVSPYEAHHLSKRESMSVNEATNLSILNSFWFVFGTLVQQGSQFSPLSLSARIISGAWWFFVLVFIASYTANMAAFLTVTKLETPVNSVSDLVKQTHITYGCRDGAATMTFFKESNIEPYKTMWTAMMLSKTSPFAKTSFDGVKRVCEEANYAYMQDSIYNAYFTNRNPIPNCEFEVVGVPFDAKGYGVGFQKGASYRDEFSQVILELREQGFIEALKTSWGLSVVSESTDTSVISNKNVLQLDNIAGIFYILAGGAVMGLLTALVEVIVYRCSTRRKDVRKEYEVRSQAGSTVSFISNGEIHRYQYNPQARGRTGTGVDTL
ncbi:glutamate receptor ionotropic, kainate 3-like [Glandiceps talaboti]